MNDNSFMAKSAPDSQKQPSFEESLASLEALVQKLEQPETPLETVIASFTEGQKLLKVCQKRLSEAQLVLEKASADGKTEVL